MEKRCFRCLCTKPVDEFYKHPKHKDGRLGKCIPCTKADVAANRLAKIEKVRAYDRQRAAAPHRRALAKQIGARWYAKHPERKYANGAVRNALSTGRLRMWPVCALPECSRQPEAHHPDYTRPLDVVWLCRPHHMQAHAINDEQEAA